NFLKKQKNGTSSNAIVAKIVVALATTIAAQNPNLDASLAFPKFFISGQNQPCFLFSLDICCHRFCITLAITGSKKWRDEGATLLAVRVDGVVIHMLSVSLRGLRQLNQDIFQPSVLVSQRDH
ncbi:MAG: hypothetical protein ACD_46C00172G0001, partial [uncultured bacterium]